MIALKEERRQLEMWNVEADEEMMHEPQSWLSWLFGYFQVVKGGNSKAEGNLQNNDVPNSSSASSQASKGS